MSNRFTIGKAEFAFSPTTAVTFEDGGMSFKLAAQPVNFDARLHGRCFDPDNGSGPAPTPVAPCFWASTFHFYDNHDNPRRLIRYPQRPPATYHHFHLFEQGFAFGIRFSGEIDLRPDRIELRGLLRRDYESDAQGVEVHVLWQFPPGPVELRPHTYGSFEEALAAPPRRVRRLLVGEWDGRWRGELLRLPQLEFLSLQNVWSSEPGQASELPEAFCTLTHLREIHLRSKALCRLPERLGDLSQLEVLSVPYSGLEALPTGIAQLHRLRELCLEGNRLRTLPECIGHLPALTRLRIEDNPFESLPASLGNIATVVVERKSEALFRDIRYRPEIEATVDREAMLVRSSPMHVALLAGALERHQLARFQGPLLRHARQALRLRTTVANDGLTPGATRIGGAPDLPPDIPYPMTDGKHWKFYAQLDLAQLAPLQTWLPRTGRLYFFGEGQELGDGCRVVHSTAVASALRTYAWPEDAEFVDDADPGPGFQVEVDATVSLPSLYNARRWACDEDAVLLEINDDDALQKAYWALEAELTGGEHGDNAHLMNAHVFTQHETPEEQASLAGGGLPQEWINLLMLASDAKPGFCFWDAGTLTFSIHEKDLHLEDFTRVLLSLESS